MQNPRLRARYRHIMAFFVRSTLVIAFWEILLPGLGLRALTRRSRPSRYRKIAADFRSLAIRMGGVMIKVGQFLSARLDVLPAEVTDELSGLQDEVPPEDFDAIRLLAEAELGAPLDDRFEVFEPLPLAAASLGQVHRARLKPGGEGGNRHRDVVVKIQRPNVDQLIDVDFSALRRFGGWLQHYKPIRRRVDVLALIEELSAVVHREIDYLQEGKNAERFAANFAGRRRVRVPHVIWSHTTVRVLTLENVYAIKITDYDAITAAGIDRREVASVLFDTYLKQIFEDRFFHADPHPGNLFVSPVPASGNRKRTWRLTFVDFGMVGSVPDHLYAGLRDVLVAIGTRDSAKLVNAYQTLGVLLPGADLELLERAEAQFFDRFWGMSMAELRKVGRAEMHQFSVQFRELLYEMPFQLPHDLLLLGRGLSILSGMCTGLDSEINPWQQLAPYAQNMLAAEGIQGWEGWLDRIGELVKELISLPAQTGRVLTRLERGEITFNAPQISRQLYYLETAVNRLVGGLVFATLLFAGVLVYRVSDFVPAYAFWGLSAVALFWTAFMASGHRPRG
jgi:predicted unusual protein kinase regulating ubiquinone biosynthesis (AarF/ABC1/UbiB family)